MPFPCRLVHLEQVPHELGYHQDAHGGAENELDDRECSIPRLCTEHGTASGDIEQLNS